MRGLMISKDEKICQGLGDLSYFDEYFGIVGLFP
jgi:hypothetical protein